MSSWGRPGRVFRPSADSEEVFVLGESTRDTLPTHAAIATASEVVASAEQRATMIIADAEAAAARTRAGAAAEASAVRDAAFRDGFDAGRHEAAEAAAAHLALLRGAAEEGKAVRDSLAAQASGVVARAVSLALRRLVGEYYEAAPERTAAVCAEALRAASGQQVLAIRVHPSVAGAVQAALVDAAEYVRPDDGVEIGGCLVDLHQGVIDASLDARFALMDLALAEAGGKVAA